MPRSLPTGLWLLLAAVAAIYWQTTGHGFLNYDDDLYLTANPHVAGGLSGEGLAWAFTSFDYFYFHPLTWISHMLDVSVFGLAPGAHHALDFLLHAVNTVLVYRLALRLLASPAFALPAAALWALHPLRVEAVAWAAERKELLAALFFLLATLEYLREPRRPLRTTLWFVLGLLAKPTMVAWPLVMAAIDRRRPLPWRPLAGWAALSAALAALVLAGQNGSAEMVAGGPLPLSIRLAHAATQTAAYLGRTFWPADLTILYPYVRDLPLWQPLAAAALLAALTAAAWTQRTARPAVWTGWLWFLLALLPMSGIVQAGAQSGADRFTYLPAIGLTIAVAALLPLRAAPYATGAAVVLAVLSFWQTATWKDSLTVMGRAVALTRDNWFASRNYALALAGAGRHRDALPHFAAALRAEPERFRFETEYHAGSSYARLDEWAAALPHFEEACRLNPAYADAHFARALALLRLRRPAEARPALEAALASGLAPRYAQEARRILASLPPPAIPAGSSPPGTAPRR